jgi:hypothetical protein
MKFVLASFVGLICAVSAAGLMSGYGLQAPIYQQYQVPLMTQSLLQSQLPALQSSWSLPMQQQFQQPIVQQQQMFGQEQLFNPLQAPVQQQMFGAAQFGAVQQPFFQQTFPVQVPVQQLATPSNKQNKYKHISI